MDDRLGRKVSRVVMLLLMLMMLRYRLELLDHPSLAQVNIMLGPLQGPGTARSSLVRLRRLQATIPLLDQWWTTIINLSQVVDLLLSAPIKPLPGCIANLPLFLP